jgi:site-specific DNA-methyltransferase (adenine-specific)
VKRKNQLIHAPAADACARLDPAAALDLVYLDPPYAAGGARTARTRAGEARAKDGKRGPVAYDDGRDVTALLEMLTASLTAIRPRMSAQAALVLHLDHRAVHDAKVACDELFGRGAFLGEVIWVPGNGARGKGLSVTHQTLLFYARRPSDRGKVRFLNDEPSLREPFAKTSLSMHFKQKDESGRHYRERVVAGKTYRYYADSGRRLGSVWTDIPAMSANTPIHREGTGYPTQKPLRLLERIIRWTTREGDTVADLMCGSGTTLVAAADLGRRFIGGDASALAIDVTTSRLTLAGIPFERTG